MSKRKYIPCDIASLMITKNIIGKKKEIPKDKQIIIETSYGTYAGIWNEPSKEFVYANPTIDLYHGEWNDTSFENEHIKEEDIISWREF